jgi:hypothetical protein
MRHAARAFRRVTCGRASGAQMHPLPLVMAVTLAAGGSSTAFFKQGMLPGEPPYLVGGADPDDLSGSIPNPYRGHETPGTSTGSCAMSRLRGRAPLRSARRNPSTAPAAGSPMLALTGSLLMGSLTCMRVERSAGWERLRGMRISRVRDGEAPTVVPRKHPPLATGCRNYRVMSP